MTGCTESTVNRLCKGVGSHISVPRAFTVLGLLRKVCDRTPLDLIATYVYQTQTQHVLKETIRRELLKFGPDDTGISDTIVVRNENTSNINVPNGLIRMSKDYLIRAFWEQLNCLDCECDAIVPEIMGPGSYRHGRGSIRTYPKDLLNVLRTIRINSGFKLWDAHSAIRDLHTACVGSYGETPNWIKCAGTRITERVLTSKMGPMEDIHLRNLMSLKSVIRNYRWNLNTKLSIPNEIEKNLLVDFYEIMLMLRSNIDYRDAYLYRKTYEHQCKHCNDSERPKYLPAHSSRFSEHKESYNINQHIPYYVNFLTPEAAICLDLCRDWYWVDSSIEHLNKTIVPEVKAYLRLEDETVHCKLSMVKNIVRDSNPDYRCGSLCEDAPCECESC
jgi:hypothetical protein